MESKVGVQQSLGKSTQTRDRNIIQHSCQELSMSLIDLKNNINACILDLESTTHIKPSLLNTMKQSMKNLERAKEVINVLNHCTLNSTKNMK